MDVAGGDPWALWKVEAAASGLPLVPGEEREAEIVKRPTPTPLPSLKAFRASPPPPKEKPTDAKLPEVSIPPRPKTGAAAVLP